MSTIIGIDLGTTNSAVAVLQGGEPILIANATGETLTPSAVSIAKGGQVLVGQAALSRATTHPEATAVAFKRDMGLLKRFELDGRKMTPPELSAVVLAQLKRDAEAFLGHPIEEAVVTVPAYFDDAQRQATRSAGEIAGLKVERIINEPTAAALAYGMHAKDRELTAVVLDVGGGTFDVTVLELIEGVIEIQSSAGDARLGGEDFVDALVAHAVAELGEIDHASSRARVRAACERAKCALSSSEDTRIVAPGIEVAGKKVDCDIAITRDEAHELWAPLLQRLRVPIRRALMDADMAADDVDEVLLVGGATRMPCVVQLAAEVFGKLPQTDLPPDEAVAMGAAVQAALKEGNEAVDDLVVTDVAPFTLGVEIVSEIGSRLVHGVFAPVIERGTVIPCSRVKRFATTEPGQTSISVKVFQGEYAEIERNRKLGEYTVKGIPKKTGECQEVDIRFTYDLNGILEVDTTVIATEKVAQMVIQRAPGRMSKGEVKKARKAMQRLKVHPRELLPNTVALERANALYVEVRGGDRDRLGYIIAAFRAALDEQDAAVIAELRDDLNATVSRMKRG